MKMKESKIITFFRIIFFISLLYYIWWIVLSIYYSFKGIDSGWAMLAMSNHELMYGYEAFYSGIIIGVLYTVQIFWFIPLYQVVYIIFRLIKYFRKKSNN